ncbi:metallophosphoesterase [Methylorubrum populi]|uniref:3',5'-cyclic adenosine monophosphate phosphodiesterase CpdA n=2 Tax=Methylobacteriaceae TaxID=119045 RepID=A0AA37HTD3_9HYPH|nr:MULTISPECIES: metallophosphoesterase [Methylobacteriaceae]MDQ0520114.1 putative phosphodiesterase [Methylobacterium gregans]BAU90597.1 metallophosphoesterase [Methylorubrum populi]GJD81266.1 3',5'-cyclic adenosine monophosphate phosphodiesterase CpdA [Methylobacterium gregans]GLS52518.1 phosphatase [Methylobacterium gregans]
MTSVLIMSDLHVDASPFELPPGPRVDIAIVAGDVADGLTRRSIPWLAEHIRPRARHVIYVPGNHDLWRARLPDEISRGRDAAIAADVTLLDCGQARHVDGIEVIGATLWTDYAVAGPGHRELAMRVAGDRQVGMRDHRLIQTRDRLGTPAPFRPPAAAALHAEHRARIERRLAETWAGPRIVVTHHAPHPRSLLHGEVREVIDAAYASDLTPMMEGPGAPDIWIHGHVHRTVDYRIGCTRVLANARGHDTSHRRRNGEWRVELENPSFDPAFVLEL